MMTVFASQEDADAACLEFERAIVDVLAGQSNRIGD
jgi:hypothetical protein